MGHILELMHWFKFAIDVNKTKTILVDRFETSFEFNLSRFENFSKTLLITLAVLSVLISYMYFSFASLSNKLMKITMYLVKFF